ncbi:MarR family winged helix-turn-helix transcriptional regulator [Pseudooceanicola onchidii]|uniref:MarR family winged helix-turn-helix transcriptional regulator n=1 Tax=Pseudooceanicola onchidii TaxID=2562279 RepID=UPI0010AA8031|nr:MarR family transcriptional regulator [Pseudooceanicola onchidii]
MDDTPLGTQDLICFALYSANNAMNRLYRPLLAQLGLTYPQYLVLVSLWDRDGKTVGQLGAELGLESNTLTPLLKRMAEAGLVTRTRADADERVVVIALTDKANGLKAEVADLAACVFEATGLTLKDARRLRDQVFALRDAIEHRDTRAD